MQKVLHNVTPFASGVARGVDGGQGRTALHLAAVHGREDMVKQLLKAKAGVDVQTKNSQGPLRFRGAVNFVGDSAQERRIITQYYG